MTVVPSQGPPGTIHKRALPGVASNMPDYDQARAEFSWAAAREELAGLPAGGLNIAYEAVDRHVDSPLADAAALRFPSKRRAASELTYAELKRATGRFANVLHGLGVGRGERVFVLAGRIPELSQAEGRRHKRPRDQRLAPGRRRPARVGR